MSEPEAAEPAVGTVIAHRWRLVERVAVEGELLGYRADDLKGGKPVRLELLDARSVASRELAARFDRDARIISRLNHPNCVSILDFGIFEARPFLVMPALSGRRLADELGKPALTVTRATRIALQLLEGLRHGHAYGVVHRELGPDKILLAGSANAPDHVKILDFGLARIRGDDKPRKAANAYGCLAPEQLQARHVDQRADLYAVGALLRAMASGQSLPASDGGGRPLGPALQRVVARALAKDPEQRFADAGEFIDELEALGEGRTAKRRKVDLAPPRRLGRPLGAALLVVAVVALGAVGWRFRARRLRHAQEISSATSATAAATQPTAPQPALLLPPAPPPTAPPAKAESRATAVVTPVSPGPPRLAPSAAPTTARAETLATPPVVARPNMSGAARPGVASPPAAQPAPRAAAPATPGSFAPSPAAGRTAPPPSKTATSAPASAPAGKTTTATAASTPSAAAAATLPPVKAAPAAAASSPAAASALGKAAGGTAAPAGESARVTAMLAAGQLAEAEAELRAQLDLHAESAELHFLLGEVFFRRFWRHDAIVEWDRALELEPALRRDPRLTGRLCATLGGKWRGAGADLIAKRAGPDAVPLLRGCVASATDLERLQTAAQLAERLGGKGAIDPQLLARRTEELTPRAP